MAERFVPYGRQWIDESDIAAVSSALEGEFLTTGPVVQEFEDKLKSITAASHAVAVNSGTAALHAAYFAAGVSSGDEIITTPLTFAATANAARYLGANVRFADIDPQTGNIDADSIEELVSETTKIIVPVDYGGLPADYDRINIVARKHGLKVVTDACHSIGASYKGKPSGSLSTAAAFSFHPVKTVTTGEGGAIVTSESVLASRAARFRTHGIVRDPAVQEEHGDWFYQMVDLGYNYRITDFQCALGLSQLAKLGSFVARRREIARRYMEALKPLSSLWLPMQSEGSESAWHLFVVRVAGDAAKRRPFFDRLRRAGLGVQVHYIPVYWHPYYTDLGYEKGLCPVAEDFYNRAVSLPIFPKMTDDEVSFCIEEVIKAAREILE
jgi:UDP-4-amino-4,6-dideoxy-N-acetyl-beta-L-altrosamine transaminase